APSSGRRAEQNWERQESALVRKPFADDGNALTGHVRRASGFRRAEIGKPRRRGTCDRIRIPQRRIAPIFDVGDYSSNALLEAHLRSPAEVGLDARYIGPGAIRLAR